MMEYSDAKFKKMQSQLQEYFDDYFLKEDFLFRLDCDVGEVWNLYLDSFPPEIKGIYYEKPWHDCQRCWSWFRTMANVVMIDDNYEIKTLFDFETIPEYRDVFKTLDEFLKTKQVKDLFLHDKSSVGVFRSFTEHEDWFEECHHFYLDIPDKFYKGSDELASEIGDARTQRKLFEDTLNLISVDAVDTVLELVYSKTLYRSNQWKDTLEGLRDVLKNYEQIDSKCDLNNWFWKKSATLPRNIVHIKNTSMGTLLLDITEGKDLEEAVTNYEKITAPENYQRPKAIYTDEMLEEAKAKIAELGYMDSLERRFAKLEDISINNVLFANRDVRASIGDSIFDELKKNVSRKVHNFDTVSEISLDEFINNVLPRAQEISLYVDSKFKNNFVSLIAPLNEDAPSMFQWDNPFSWTYENNITDSLMKEQVKKMGGDVDVDLRFSIQWNDGDVWDKNDLDAHSTEPDGNEIYFSKMKSKKTGGWLDVDIINPVNGEIAVENIQYKHKDKMIEGEYLFRVHQYSYRGGDGGFKAEVEFDNRIHSFDYPNKLSQGEYVNVAKVKLKDGLFTLTDLIGYQIRLSNTNHWNIALEDFVPVSLICFSPNYWNDNEFGNKHIFFMLNDCINDTNPSGWFNEYLNNELHPNRKVMEALSSRIRVEDTENQLSGVGFSLGKLGERKVTVKVKTNNIDRIWNVIM
ncbi:MAG: hypothetical protein IK044_02860 [Methanobrevibacter sp.]|nr:hypothetical protein [Methanobrevibacter sp.]